VLAAGVGRLLAAGAQSLLAAGVHRRESSIGAAEVVNLFGKVEATMFETIEEVIWMIWLIVCREEDVSSYELWWKKRKKNRKDGTDGRYK
jgi:hypothetical protein